MPRKPTLTPEERLARPALYLDRYRERARLRYHAKRAAMTPEELAEFNRRSRINRKASYQRNKAKERAKAQALYRTPEGKEKQRARNKARRAQNPEFWRAYDRLAYQRNIEGHRRSQKRWVENNRASTVVHANKRRARVRGASRNDVTTEQRALVLALAKGRCVYCAHYNPTCKLCPKGKHEGLTVDHISAVGPEGPNTLQNLVACCRSCNSSKRRKPNPIPVQPLLL
jgi:5-methylcytosine-specific restriction endonuclease McrA